MAARVEAGFGRRRARLRAGGSSGAAASSAAGGWSSVGDWLVGAATPSRRKRTLSPSRRETLYSFARLCSVNIESSIAALTFTSEKRRTVRLFRPAHLRAE